ncbi:ATL2 protein, partial [Polypterus senegalus]
MSIEVITIDQRTVTYRVVSMPGDGTYLFHSLCYILHGHIRLTLDIRRSYVLNDWDRFKVWTDDGTGDNYTTQEHYKSEMLKPFTYGSACLLQFKMSTTLFVLGLQSNMSSAKSKFALTMDLVLNSSNVQTSTQRLLVEDTTFGFHFILVCPDNGLSFKQQQCSNFNAKAFGRRYYLWIPLYPDDYINISNKPCDLQCTTANGERQLLVPAHDGTSCKDRIFQGVCIEGKCEVVGCDGILYSSKTADKCGVCGGNGLSCHRISGSYRKGITQLGIPYVVHPQYYNINGKMPHITYEYTVPTSSVLITVPPAMDVDLYIHVPEPDFEKTVKDLNMKNGVEKPDSIPGSSHTTIDLSYNDNEIDSVEDYGSENSTSSLAFVSNLASEQETDGLIWELQPPLNLSTDPSLLILKQMNTFFHNRVYNKLADKSGQTGDASMPGMTNASLGDQHETRLSFKHLFLGILSKPAGVQRSCNNRSSHDAGCFKKASAESHPIHQNSSTFLKNNLSLKIFSGSLDSELRTRPEERDPYDLISEMEYSMLNSSTSHNLPLLNLHSFQPVQAPATESNEFEVESIDHDISLADMYRWKVSAYAPCSSTCTTGISTSYAMCVRYDGVEVDETYCDAVTRPEPTQEFCTGKECPPRVTKAHREEDVQEQGVWATVGSLRMVRGICGEGQMTRYVACKNSNGNIISDTQCDPDLKPLAAYPCGDKNCPAHWVKQEWEQCNATCGRGVKRRLVICAGLENGVYKEFPDQSCNSIPKPEEEAACFERPCSKWFTTSWSQCSKTCGTGVKVRETKCYQGEEVGHSCDTSTKPESRQSCEIQPCPTEIPDEACQDKASANCALVLKVKLCTHWYYRKACCQSCKNKSP